MNEQQTIRQILEALASSKSKITSEIQCIYSDGRDVTIYCLFFYHQEENIGKISFRSQDGQVCKYFYKGLVFNKNSNIVDLLVEVYNYETDLSIF